jgi:NADH:ubiquinone oxidoreductase subunit 6 (subunit J)
VNFFPLLILFLAGFALMVIHAKRLITVSIALASVSALTSTMLYLAGAQTAAVIELSVGAGLVAVLFAFTNSLLAERSDNLEQAIPRLLALVLAGLVFGILLMNSLGFIPGTTGASDTASYFWEERGADLVAQMALMFSTVLGVLGLLAERDVAHSKQAIKEGQ